MAKMLSIRQGPYAGQNLQLEDDVAASALADGWGVDVKAADYDPYNSPNVNPSDPYPQSLTDFLATIAEGGVSNDGSEGSGGGNGGGGEDLPPPVVDELVPATAELNSPDVTLHVMGSGFVAGSVIVFAGQDEPIVFVSDEEITTIITLSLPWGAVKVPVFVRNPDGQESASLDFEFTEAP